MLFLGKWYSQLKCKCDGVLTKGNFSFLLKFNKKGSWISNNKQGGLAQLVGQGAWVAVNLLGTELDYNE